MVTIMTPVRQTIGQRIKQLREAKGYTQQKLSELSGVERSYITLLETRRAKGRISMETALALCKALEVDPQVLFDEADIKLPEPVVTPPSSRPMSSLLREVKEKYEALDLIEIPVRGTTPCGYPLLEEETAEGTISLPKEQLGNTNTDNLYALKVSGESLIGDGIYPADFLIVEPTGDVIDGKIYTVRLGNEVCARHVFKLDNSVKLVSSNGEYKELKVSEIEILGKVILSGRWKKH